MKITKNYPARTVEKKVVQVRFVFGQNIAYVELVGEHPEVVKVDLSKTSLTPTKLKTIQEFLAGIIAEAAEIKIEEVPKTEILKTKITKLKT